ncbi:MAG: UvrD-helicase domain-containing protein [Desulfovibrio sp.]|jgi:uncharacterized protein (TIGR00375 family)|nr:UvrD-helicase domain-containing protein [Desulfovibrio sp.]
MSFVADLHVHSSFSRATSRSITLSHLAGWGACKGIGVLGTGDFTHPKWRGLMERDLVLDEATGFYRLGEESWKRERALHPLPKDAAPPLFCLQAEISSIYKRHDKVHKVHNLVYVPTLEDANAFSRRLEAIGNLSADGRPILGLDSRDLLELLLETCQGAVLVPAHIWTPWFSVFGSRSGFDSLEECFGDLTDHVFALETGLSSDPPMNRMVSGLDDRVLISNSDAHSGANLGREANRFDGPPSYAGMFAALRTSARRGTPGPGECAFLGTVEFFPEEGKYHLDGHRACGVVVTPGKDPDAKVCPVCGKPLTLGVLHRVLDLADRAEPPDLPGEPESRYLIPLAQVIAEILHAGVTSKKVQERYTDVLQRLGPELDVLTELPEEDVRRFWEPLGEAVHRIRRGEVRKEGGFDGQFGVIRVFDPDERTSMGRRPRAVSGIPAREAATAPSPRPGAPTGGPAVETGDEAKTAPKTDAAPPVPADGLSDAQRAAMLAMPGPILIMAGPGAGKTRVLVGRLLHLLSEGTPPEDILCLTFTRRAAEEIKERLHARLPGAPLPTCDTLHGHGWHLLRQTFPDAVPLSEEAAFGLFRIANPDTPARTLRSLWQETALCRETLTPMGDESAACFEAYRRAKEASRPRLLDFADVLEFMSGAAVAPVRHLLVDEVQDLSPLQLGIVRRLVAEDGRGFFGIGDPDQAIYGFRGARGVTEDTLRDIWPHVRTHRLAESYRAGQGVLDMARRLLEGNARCGALTAHHPIPTAMRCFVAPNPAAEAAKIARIVSRLLGGSSHTLQDATRRGENDELDGIAGELAPSDIAVLVRLKAQMPVVLSALQTAGVPAIAPADGDIADDPLCARLLDLVARGLGMPHGGGGDAEALPWRDPLPSPSAMSEWIDRQPWAGAGTAHSRAWRHLCALWTGNPDWRRILETVAWQREAELARARAEHVQILTMHASKGLEFKAVFLPGLEEGILPFSRRILYGDANAKEGDAGLEEERRLMYVGLTRASHALFLSACLERTLAGRKIALAQSPLLEAIRGMCRQSAIVARTRSVAKQAGLPLGPWMD